ncbi:hypothetical protein J6590_023371 [Homalodisca vitripennis]|nr:hypothetical protein J6590_023371 [Homalodisca vitripennis]
MSPSILSFEEILSLHFYQPCYTKPRRLLTLPILRDGNNKHRSPSNSDQLEECSAVCNPVKCCFPGQVHSQPCQGCTMIGYINLSRLILLILKDGSYEHISTNNSIDWRNVLLYAILYLPTIVFQAKFIVNHGKGYTMIDCMNQSRLILPILRDSNFEHTSPSNSINWRNVLLF